MASRPGHRASRSFHVTVLPMAPPFSPATDSNRRVVDYSPSARHSKRLNSVSTIPRKELGFESREPTSPKVSCMGQIKMKPQRAKASKQAGADKAVKDNNNKLSKLKKLMLGGRRRSNKAEDDAGGGDAGGGAAGGGAKQGEEEKKGFPSLGQMKRYTSGSYDTKFGAMFVEEGPIVAHSGSFILDGFPKAVTKMDKEEPGINIWKRRSIPPLAVLNVEQTTVEGFEPRKPFTK